MLTVRGMLSWLCEACWLWEAGPWLPQAMQHHRPLDCVRWEFGNQSSTLAVSGSSQKAGQDSSLPEQTRGMRHEEHGQISSSPGCVHEEHMRPCMYGLAACTAWQHAQPNSMCYIGKAHQPRQQGQCGANRLSVSRPALQQAVKALGRAGSRAPATQRCSRHMGIKRGLECVANEQAALAAVRMRPEPHYPFYDQTCFPLMRPWWRIVVIEHGCALVHDSGTHAHSIKPFFHMHTALSVSSTCTRQALLDACLSSLRAAESDYMFYPMYRPHW